MAASDFTEDQVEDFFEKGIEKLIEKADREKTNIDTLKILVKMLCPGAACSEEFTDLKIKQILRTTIKIKMVDAYFTAIDTKPEIDTRDAILIGMASSRSLIKMFGSEMLDKIAIQTADRLL